MSNSRLFILVLILLLGAVSRRLHITDQSLWVDEGYAFYHAHFPSLIETLARDTHPPLYFGALRLWSEVTGDSELALRWFSLLPSMLSLAVIYQLAREILRSREENSVRSIVPVIAVLMLALADAENYLSQEVRHYTWLVLLVSCGMWMFLRWIRISSRRAYWLWIIFTILMVHTHYITAFIGITQGVYALIALRGKVRIQAIAGLMLSALALSPWLLLVGVHQLGNDGTNWSVPLNATSVIDIRGKYLTQQWSLMLGLLALGCVTVIYQVRDSFRIRWHKSTLLLLLWLILPFALTVIVNEFLPFLQPRRLTQWTPVIALLVAFGLGNIQKPIRGLMIAVLLVYGVSTVDFARYEPDWREIATMMTRYAHGDQLVVSDIVGGDYQLQYYINRTMPEGAPYSNLLDEGVRYESLKTMRDFYPDEYQTWLPALMDSTDTVWMMYWSDEPSALAWLDKLGFKQTALFTYLHDGGATGLATLSIFRFDRLADNEPVAIFDNGMILRSATVDGADLRVDLLWSAEKVLDRDYAVSAKLLDSGGQVVAQMDVSHPQLNQRPTSIWTSNDLIFDPHELALHDGLSALPVGEYQAIVQVYVVDEGAITNIPTDSGEEWFTLETIEISG